VPGCQAAVLVAEHLTELLRRPDEEAALDPAAVGVLRGGEAAAGQPHLAQRVVEHVGGGPPPALLAAELPGVQVHGSQLGVVVEHLLEVGHGPLSVDGVAVEAAADLVVDAAARHPVEGDLGGVPEGRVPGRPIPSQQQVEGGRVRELRRPAEAAVALVGVLDQLPAGLVERRRAQLALGQARRRQRLAELLPGLVDGLALLAVGLGDGAQDAREAAHLHAVVGGEVGAAEEGHAAGGEEDGHRPSALAGERDHRLHVDAVDVRALLAVDLDVHEELVLDGRDLGVLEGLVGHHVAPVTGAVADAEQHRLVEPPRLLEGLVAPRPPVDGVVAVLEQVGAGLAGEAVGHVVAHASATVPLDEKTGPGCRSARPRLPSG